MKINALRQMIPQEMRNQLDSLDTEEETFEGVRDYILRQSQLQSNIYVGDTCHKPKANADRGPGKSDMDIGAIIQTGLDMGADPSEILAAYAALLV